MTLPTFNVTGRAKKAFTSAVASAGERPPTSTSPATVTPAAIVVGRGTVGVVVVVVVVVVGGGGGAVVVVPVVVVPVPVSAVADGVAANRAAERTPAAAHTTNRANVSPRRLTRPV